MGSEGRVRVLLHSIACGNVKPVAPAMPDHETDGRALARDDDFEFTIQAMGTSLLTWVRAVHQAGLFAPDARVIGLTSEGARRAIRGYAPVSAAKAVLESISRAIALEFAPLGIRSNIIQAGVAETPALLAIPDHEAIARNARQRNPFGRLTEPEDIANTVFLLSLDEASWINGTVIHADGGEHLSV
jgi:enoyl-[acyl-carrier protein] reductase I